MSTFSINYSFREPGGVIVTPPGGADFTNNKAELSKTNKLFEDSIDLTSPVDPSLRWTGSRLEQVNEYGVDNEITCVWTSNTDSNYSKYSPAFKVNNAQITPTVFGDATVVNKGASDGLYTIIENRGYLDGSDNFVKNNNYLIYVKYGSPNKLLIFDFAADLWFIETANDDPNLWTNGQATGVSGSTSISNFTETVGTFFRATPNVDLTYQPDNNEFADISNGLVSFSDDFFVGKSDFYYEADHQISSLTGSANIFWIRYTTLANFIRLHQAGNFLRLAIKDNNNITTTLEYDLSSDPLDLKGNGTGFSKGDELNVSWEYQDKLPNPNGNVWLKINGNLVDSAILTASIKSNEFAAMLFDQQSNFLVKNFRFQSSLKHQGANFIPETTLPSEPYSEVIEQFYNNTYNQLGEIVEYLGLTSNDYNNVKFIINGKYWNGAAWVASSDTYATANTLAEVDANISALTITQTNTLKIVFKGNALQGYIDVLSFDYNGQQREPAASLTTTATVQMDRIETLTAGITTPDEYSKVTFCPYIDGQLYWYDATLDGGNGAWAEANGSVAESNELSELTTEVWAKLTETGSLRLTAFLSQDVDPDLGYQNLESPSITWAQFEIDYQVPDAIPPREGVVYTFLRDTCTDPGTQFLVIETIKTFVHGDVTVEKGECEHAAVGSSAIINAPTYETETLNADITEENKKYKYLFKMRTKKQVTNRGVTSTQNIDEVLGYAEVPDVNEVRLADLVFSDIVPDYEPNKAV